MPTIYSGDYWTGSWTYTRVKVDYSGTSATATLLYNRTNTYSQATGANGATFTFGNNSVVFNKTFYGKQTDAYVASVNFTISTNGGRYYGSTADAGYLSFSGSIDIPAQASAPTGLSCSNISATYDTVTATVSVTGWGGAGDASTRYRNLSVMQTNDKPTSIRRYQRVYGNTMSSAITVNNSTQYGTMTIVPNTRYWLWWYATNGTYAAESPNPSTTTVITLAKPAELSIDDRTDDSITFNYNTFADGGYYAKTYEYSIDGGTTWTTFATVADGSASSGSFTITGLSVGNTYTLKTRAVTTAGTSNATDVVFTIPATNKFYGPVNGEATNAYKMYGSVNGQTKEIKKVYGSVNGEAVRIL